MRQTTLRRDFSGVAEAGPFEWTGAEVWGTGGNTGFTRDGTHAELIAVPVESLRRKPDKLNFDQAHLLMQQLHLALPTPVAADTAAMESSKGHGSLGRVVAFREQSINLRHDAMQ